MGNPKQKWTTAEEEALKRGIAKHGTGKWKVILRDPEFNSILYSRSNIDLKDKWRNMGVTTAMPRPKSSNNVDDASPLAASELPTSTYTGDAMSIGNSAFKSGDITIDQLIFETLTALKNPNFTPIKDIFEYIQATHEIPPNFRRQLCARLRKLAEKDILLKMSQSYKLKNDEPFVTTQPLRNQNRTQLQGTAYKSAGNIVDRPVKSAAGQTPIPSMSISPTKVKADDKDDDEEEEDEGDDAMNIDEDTDSMLDLAEELEAELLEEDVSCEYTAEMVAKVVENAVAEAANEIADAENKSYVAAEAVKEEDRVARMAEETESVLQLANEIFKKCSLGKVVHVRSTPHQTRDKSSN